MSLWDDLFTVQPPTNQYSDARESDNPPLAVYDPYPDTSLGGEFDAFPGFDLAGAEQESLGREIVAETQRGWEQEELGRGIVQESLGKSILDSLLRNPDNTQPWFKGVDGSLAGVARVMAAVPGLLGQPDPTPTSGGIPGQVGTTANGRVVSMYPPNATRDGRSGTLMGVRPVATGTLQFGGMDYLYVTLGLIGAYAAYRVIRAL